MNVVIVLVIGVIIGFMLGYITAEKVSQHVLTTAHQEGLQQGRAQREWEVMRLWDRVNLLERRNQP